MDASTMHQPPVDDTRPDMTDDFANGSPFEDSGPSPEIDRHRQGVLPGDDDDSGLISGIMARPSDDADSETDLDGPRLDDRNTD